MKPPSPTDAKNLAEKLGVGGVIIVAIAGDMYSSTGFADSDETNKHVSRITDLLAAGIKQSQLEQKRGQSFSNQSPEDSIPQYDVQQALDQADSILERVEELPAAGWDFGESVAEKVREISQNISRHKRVTAAQQEALDNMEAGIGRWFHE